MAEISLSKANKIISEVFKKGAAEGLKPLAAVVLDSGGHMKAAQRQDGASSRRATAGLHRELCVGTPHMF